MQKRKQKNIIWITIIFIQIFILYIIGTTNINKPIKEIEKNFSFTPKDFMCQNGIYKEDTFIINETNVKDKNKDTIFTYGIREKVLSGIYQLNIQYNTNSENNYIEITYYDKYNNVINKDIFYLQSKFNNITENFETNSNIDNIDIKTYYGNIGELKLSKINFNLINETNEYNKFLMLLCIFIIFDVLLFFTLLIINKIQRRNKKKRKENDVEKKEVYQIDNSQSTINEIDEFFNEWLKLNDTITNQQSKVKEENDFYSSIVEHQLEDLINLNNDTKNEYNRYINMTNSIKEDFDFRYAEEDFALTEDYKNGYVE